MAAAGRFSNHDRVHFIPTLALAVSPLSGRGKCRVSPAFSFAFGLFPIWFVCCFNILFEVAAMDPASENPQTVNPICPQPCAILLMLPYGFPAGFCNFFRDSFPPLLV